jgi:DNA gyrase subunit A
MERSYLEYAMSVIVGRALPDVRDGLKPVHRRIIYAMHELGLTPDRPFRKCARVVGDVLGKYHPHGDQSVYDALVRMAQDFSSRYPLLGGHGNFGSIDNDPPAAMRYTETRLSPMGHEAMLGNISEAIVDFTDNFDNSQQEPTVLPAQLPFLLLEGCSGIAVGMATNIPPHNLGEIIDGSIALIDNPELPDEELWQIIPGPDFPTGGEIIDNQGIEDAYRTGRGTIPVRGIARVEKLYRKTGRRRERTAIVVTELPYQVNKAAWIEKIAELVNLGRLEGISDLRDESDRNGMRVVIELKRDTTPQSVLAELYQHTALQSNFGAILLALVDNKPCQLSLRQMLQAFLDFREATLTRQYRHDLGEAERRLHLVAGLLAALENLDAVIDILRHAPDGTAAKRRFQEELDLSEAQADAILAMPLRRLTGLERQKLQAESQELQERIAQLRGLLEERRELLKVLKKDLRTLKRKFGDERRTRIRKVGGRSQEAGARRQEAEGRRQEAGSRSQEAGARRQEPGGRSQEAGARRQEPGGRKQEAGGRKQEAIDNTDQSKIQNPKSKIQNPPPSPQLQLFTPQPPPEGAILEITHRGYIHWQPAATTERSEAGDAIYRARVGKQEQLIAIADNGKAYPIPLSEIPPAGVQLTQLGELLPNSAQERENRIISQFFLPETPQDLILLTQQGRIKRLSYAEFAEPLSRRGISFIKLKEGDGLSHVCWGQEGQELAIATSGGRVLRVSLTDEQLPQMGRTAQGEKALRLRYGESLAGCVALNPQDNLLLASQLGYVKRLPLSALRLAKLGDIGTQALQFSSQEDHLAGIALAVAKGTATLVTNRERTLSLSVDSVNLWGKDGMGELLALLKAGEMVLQLFLN